GTHPGTPTSRSGRPGGHRCRRGSRGLGPDDARSDVMNLLRIILVAALAALAGLSYSTVFGGFGAMLLLATLIPPGAVVGWTLWTRPHRMSPAIAGLGVLTVAVAVAVTTRPGSAAASGPYRLLTEALPTDPGGPELATAS